MSSIGNQFIPATERVRPVDGLRAISILWVMGFHVLYFAGYFFKLEEYQTLLRMPFAIPFAQGQLGVDIFFVISGYLIAGILLREQRRTGTIHLARFYLRRAFRILPVYVLVLLLARLILKELSCFENAWANILLINNFLPIEKQALGWSWSLAIEEQFYLFLPLILLLARRPPANPRAISRKALPLLFGLLALAFVIRAALVLGLDLTYPNPFHISFDTQNFRRYFDGLYDKPYSRFGGILCGVLVAYLEQAETPLLWLNRHARLARVLLFAASLGLLLLATRPGYVKVAERASPLWATLRMVCDPYVFAMLVAYLLFYTLARGHAGISSLTRRILSFRLLFPLATLSYGAYLVHPIIAIALWSRYARHGLTSVVLVAVLTYALTFFFSYLIFATVENPLRQWGRRLSRTKFG